jgi:hypothetical protein
MIDDDGSNVEDLIGFLLAQADRSTDLHREVYETFEDSGLADAMSEYGPKLSRFPPELTLPAYDLEFESEETLTSVLKGTRDDPWNVREAPQFPGSGRSYSHASAYQCNEIATKQGAS